MRRSTTESAERIVIDRGWPWIKIAHLLQRLGRGWIMAQLNPNSPLESWRWRRRVSGALDRTIGVPGALVKKTMRETVPCAEQSTAQSDEPLRSRLACTTFSG